MRSLQERDQERMILETRELTCCKFVPLLEFYFCGIFQRQDMSTAHHDNDLGDLVLDSSSVRLKIDATVR